MNTYDLATKAANGMLTFDAEGEWRLSQKEAERFAALVAAKEREIRGGQPARQPLTDMEISVIALQQIGFDGGLQQVNGFDIKSLVRAVEAAHGITQKGGKNE